MKDLLEFIVAIISLPFLVVWAILNIVYRWLFEPKKKPKPVTFLSYGKRPKRRNRRELVNKRSKRKKI